MIWVLSQNPIFKKHIGWFSISFFLTASPHEQPQASNIQDMIQIEANCFTMGSEEFVVEESEHKVCLNSYYLGIYEVTKKKLRTSRGKSVSLQGTGPTSEKYLIARSRCLFSNFSEQVLLRFFSGSGILTWLN